MPKKKTANPYSIHPGVAMVQKWITDLPSKTGRTIDQWMVFINKQKLATQKEVRSWLKSVHGIGSNTAWWLAERANPAGETSIAEEDPQVYLEAAVAFVDTMFAGAKAGLRPIYEEILKFGVSLGKDVRVCPCQTIVPFYRRHVFAQAKPTTRTRLDLGLCLTPLVKAGKKLPARLLDTGGFGKKDRITHRIPLASVKEFDADAKKWMAKAYELDAKENSTAK